MKRSGERTTLARNSAADSAAPPKPGHAPAHAPPVAPVAPLPMLPSNNVHVRSDLSKISDGKKLSPILLVRGDAARAVPLQIADGYHRVCAGYLTDENTVIPCRLASWPS